jgi:hypothetical protein
MQMILYDKFVYRRKVLQERIKFLRGCGRHKIMDTSGAGLHAFTVFSSEPMSMDYLIGTLNILTCHGALRAYRDSVISM